MTKVGIISDVHASPVPLKEALDIFARENVSDIFCAGDIAGYFDLLDPAIQLLNLHHCKTIMGNHDQSYLESCSDNQNSTAYSFLTELPETLECTIENKKIYIVHAHPPSSQHGGIKLLDQNGGIIPQQKKYWTKILQDFDHDVLIVGHTHQVYAELLGDVLVVNPGSTQFNHSCMILSLPDLTVQTFSLENREIIKSWNFSMLYGSHSRYPSRKK